MKESAQFAAALGVVLCALAVLVFAVLRRIGPALAAAADASATETCHAAVDWDGTGPVPPALAAEVPSVRAVQRRGAAFAYQRWYQVGGPGEWYLLGLANDRQSAFMFIVPPEAPRLPREGGVDLVDLPHWLAQIGVQIKWDPEFARTRYDASRLARGEHPVEGRRLGHES